MVEPQTLRPLRRPIDFRSARLGWTRTYLMGVVNATPDSFSDGGMTVDQLRAHARALVEAGADLVDVGAESTRPGAEPVPGPEQIRRLGPVLDALRGARAVVSVDTCLAEVADWALGGELAEVVNDISGGTLDPDLVKVAARRGAVVVLGHLRGTPGNMRAHATYDDVVRQVRDELAERVARAVEAGVLRERIWIDPGLGFAKTAEQSAEVLRRLGELGALGCPIVVGASRKSFLGQLTGRPVGERELATAAAHTAAILAGADVVRVHDVAAQRDAVRVADALRGGRS